MVLSGYVQDMGDKDLSFKPNRLNNIKNTNGKTSKMSWLKVQKLKEKKIPGHSDPVANKKVGSSVHGKLLTRVVNYRISEASSHA